MVTRAQQVAREAKVAREFSSTQKHLVTLIPGDGIGPEISDSVQRIFETASVSCLSIILVISTTYIMKNL